MSTGIRHEGIVNSIDGQKITVRILQASACSGCQASKICRAAESKEKLVEIEMKGADTLSVGQTVTIAGEESMGMTGVMLAFGLPLLLLIAGLVTAVSVTGSEKIGAAVALGILVPYYIVLMLLNKKKKKDFQFRIIQ